MNKLIVFCSYLILLSSCKETPQFVSFTYPEGKYKALVLSYDDGSIQDIELTNLFNQNNLVGTFNLNSKFLGITKGWPQKNGDTIYQKYVPKDSLLYIYKNHEIAAHGAFHKNFTDITLKEVEEEISTDLKILTELTKRKIVSMAYPFGNTNDSIANLISTLGIINGRTVNDTHNFKLPKNDMIWNPTCHDSKALDYLDSYLQLNKKKLSLFYVWGHSWEFGNKKRWHNMVTFCKKISEPKDIWSVGNGELTHYLNAIKNIEFNTNSIKNPINNQTIWVELTNGITPIKPGETINIKH